jgi:hypothetical protein
MNTKISHVANVCLGIVGGLITGFSSTSVEVGVATAVGITGSQYAYDVCFPVMLESLTNINRPEL